LNHPSGSWAGALGDVECGQDRENRTDSKSERLKQLHKSCGLMVGLRVA
jgi:hypothetical protein